MTAIEFLRTTAAAGTRSEARPSKFDRYKHYIDKTVRATAPDWIGYGAAARVKRAQLCGRVQQPEVRLCA
jgi:transposase